jgi:hypothetical protein
LRIEPTQPEFFFLNIEGKINNPLYKDDIENEFQQNIHDIKKKPNNIQA